VDRDAWSKARGRKLVTARLGRDQHEKWMDHQTGQIPEPHVAAVITALDEVRDCPDQPVKFITKVGKRR
jgi:hypothetical protein